MKSGGKDMLGGSAIVGACRKTFLVAIEKPTRERRGPHLEDSKTSQRIQGCFKEMSVEVAGVRCEVPQPFRNKLVAL